MRSGIWLVTRVIPLVFLLLSWPAQAVAPLPESARQSLGGMIQILEDPGQELSLEQVRDRDDWQDHPDTAFNKGYSQSVWWIRWSIINEADEPQERILSIDYPLLRDLRLHMGSDRSPDWEQLRMGAGLPFSERPLEDRRFAVPQTWEAGETRHFYLRVRTDTAFQVPITLSERSAFHANSTLESTAKGIYVGALLSIGLYNLLLFLMVRDRNYLLYVGVVFSIVLMVATLNGFTFRYFWPEATQWNNQSIIVFCGLILFFASLFSSSFLEVRRYSRWLNVVLIIQAVAGVMVMLLSGVVDYYTAILFTLPFVVFGTVFGPCVAVYLWVRGQHTAPYYLLAWSFLLVGLLVLALSKSGFLPLNVFTGTAGEVGSFMEVLLLSFALAQRINVERRLRLQAQEEMLEASERHNRELEERVGERTAELERVNQKLNELSITDGLTGLNNRRYLDEVLPREVARARRNGKPLSVVMIDIDRFKPLNDCYGHQAGDACLERLGQITGAMVRAPDIAVRYGGEEFALVLVDADAPGALRVVERLRQQLSKMVVVSNGHELSFTISAGIASCFPGEALSEQALMRQADQALYRAKAEGRDRACVHDPEADTSASS